TASDKIQLRSQPCAGGRAKAPCSTPRPIRALSLFSSKTCAPRAPPKTPSVESSSHRRRAFRKTFLSRSKMCVPWIRSSPIRQFCAKQILSQTPRPAEAAGHSDEKTAYLRRMDHVGRRVAELQLALASRNDIAAFAPEPIAADDV